MSEATPEKTDKPLSIQEQVFVTEYCKDFNCLRAAKAAKYAVRAAQANAWRLLERPRIINAIRAELDRQQRETGIDANWILRRLRDELTADIADLFDANGTVRPIREWPYAWRQGLVTEVKVDEKVSTKTGKVTSRRTTLKIADRHKRLELAAKHVDVRALFDRERGPGGGTINVWMLPEDIDGMGKWPDGKRPEVIEGVRVWNPDDPDENAD